MLKGICFWNETKGEVERLIVRPNEIAVDVFYPINQGGLLYSGSLKKEKIEGVKEGDCYAGYLISKDDTDYPATVHVFTKDNNKFEGVWRDHETDFQFEMQIKEGS